MESAAEAIIEQIESGYADIVRLYQSVPVTALLEISLTNGWSVKDVLAHIAAWEWRCASLLEASHDSTAFLKAQPDEDALNLETYQERKEWGWEEVEYDFRATHQTLLQAIRELPADRLNDKLVQERIAQNTWQHYIEHLPDIKHWHKQITG